MANQFFYSSLMTATGIGIPIMAALSAGLGSRYGNSGFAASVLYFVALSISLIFLFAMQGGVPDAPKTAVPIQYCFGGIFVAFCVLNIAWVAPRFGVGNAPAFVLSDRSPPCQQSISSD